MSRLAEQIRGPSRRWGEADPWTRFGLISVFILLIAGLVPETFAAGSASATSTSSTLPAPDSFPFDADQFLDRWNSVETGTEQLNTALSVVEYDSHEATIARFHLSYPDESLDWNVAVTLDPVAGDVINVGLIGPLGDIRTTDSNSVGALMVIAAVEGLSSAKDSVPTWNTLLEAIPQGLSEFTVSTTTPNATFRLSLSTETLFMFEATP